MEPFRLIDHTADLGIQVFGRSLEELFSNSATALFSIIYEGAPSGKSERKEIMVRGDGTEDLLVNWLRELHFTWAGSGLLLEKVDNIKMDEKSIKADALFFEQDENQQILNEVKAVTYHGLRVEKKGDLFFATVIFDL